MEPELMSRLLELAQHFVFWCSIATLVLAGIERSLQKFYPDSGVAKVIAFAADLVGQFGALNLRDKIAPKGREVWSDEQRNAAQEKK